MAPRRKNAPFASKPAEVFWIGSCTGWRSYRKICPPATVAGSTNIWTTCARSSAASRRWKATIAPVGVPDSFEEHVKLMFDLQALAFTTDTTRVSAFKMSRDVCQRVYPESGVKVPFHSASHHGETPAKIADFAKINRYHVSLVPYFLEKLKNTPDGDGNLLDHSLILYGSPLGDSNAHNHKRVPVFLAGHANGKVKGNLHVRCQDMTPMANVLLTVMHQAGMNIESIGDSTGVIAI